MPGYGGSHVAQVDFLGESTTGNLHLVGREQEHGIGNVLGLASVDDIVDMPVNQLRQATKVSEGVTIFF